jgi:hypothetical protein
MEEIYGRRSQIRFTTKAVNLPVLISLKYTLSNAYKSVTLEKAIIQFKLPSPCSAGPREGK